MLTDSEGSDFTVERLIHPEAFPHEVTALELLETHISWIILTGPFAYKIKKPVIFDFVDYSTFGARKEYCQKEVELNRRFAPNLYLDVVPIREVDGKLMVGNESLETSDNRHQSEPIEYAVKMRQFPQEAIVAARLQSPELSAEVVEQFGKYIADFHESIESAIPTIHCVQSERIEADALENFANLREAFQDDVRTTTLDQLEHWTSDQFKLLEPEFQRRLNAGLVRRCHGDLHLKNVIQIDGQLIAFDGIEFNEEFQWIDGLSEIAFPVMDFVARGRADLGWRLLNSYLEATGEYREIDVLRFYLVYRAMVRAKVTWLNPKNHPDEKMVPENDSEDGLNIDKLEGTWDKYLAAASYFAFELKPKLFITHGFSGSGKSMLAMQVIDSEGGVRIRSDVERHRLSKSFKISDEYSPEMDDWVYSQLLELAKSTLKAGLPVVVDATFLKKHRRARFEMLAREFEVEFEIIDCDAPFEELCRRIQLREFDPSEATIDVLKLQMETHDPLTTEELQYVRKISQ